MNIVKHETIEYTCAEMNRLLAVKCEFENLSRSVTDPELKTFAEDLAADLDFFISKYTDINIEEKSDNCAKNCDYCSQSMNCNNNPVWDE